LAQLFQHFRLIHLLSLENTTFLLRDTAHDYHVFFLLFLLVFPFGGVGLRGIQDEGGVAAGALSENLGVVEADARHVLHERPLTAAINVFLDKMRRLSLTQLVRLFLNGGGDFGRFLLEVNHFRSFVHFRVQILLDSLAGRFLRHAGA